MELLSKHTFEGCIDGHFFISLNKFVFDDGNDKDFTFSITFTLSILYVSLFQFSNSIYIHTPIHMHMYWSRSFHNLSEFLYKVGYYPLRIIWGEYKHLALYSNDFLKCGEVLWRFWRGTAHKRFPLISLCQRLPNKSLSRFGCPRRRFPILRLSFLFQLAHQAHCAIR